MFHFSQATAIARVRVAQRGRKMEREAALAKEITQNAPKLASVALRLNLARIGQMYVLKFNLLILFYIL